MYPSIALFKTIFRNDFGKYAKHHGLKVDTDVLLYEDQDVGPKVVGLAIISSVAVTDPDEFQRPVHCGEQNCGLGSDLIFIKAVIIQKDSFTIPYPYEIHWTSINEVRKP